MDICERKHPILTYSWHQTDLWVEAIKELDDEDKSLIWPHVTEKLTVLDDVLASAKERQAECEKKRWKYKKRDGTEVELRQIFDKIVQKVSQFKELGDSVAALDSTHLAVPCGAIKLILQVCCDFLYSRLHSHISWRRKLTVVIGRGQGLGIPSSHLRRNWDVFCLRFCTRKVIHGLKPFRRARWSRYMLVLWNSW